MRSTASFSSLRRAGSFDTTAFRSSANTPPTMSMSTLASSASAAAPARSAVTP